MSLLFSNYTALGAVHKYWYGEHLKYYDSNYNGHEFKWALGEGDGQESQMCCSPWGHNESDMTEWLNWTDPNVKEYIFFFGPMEHSPG